MIDLSELTIVNVLVILVISLILGILISVVFRITNRKNPYEPTFVSTLIILPIVVSIIIILVNNNIARAFSLAGIFTLVRFRMSISNSRDISYILTTVAVGLGLSLGYIGLTVLVVVFINLVLLGIYLFDWEKSKNEYMKLKLQMPENLDYYEVFQGVFDKYLKTYKLMKMKTTDFGTIFELTYAVVFKDIKQQKEFIDEVRVKNGNLSINLSSSIAPE